VLRFEGPNAEAIEEFVARAVMLPRQRLEQVDELLAGLLAERRAVADVIRTSEALTRLADELRTFIHDVAYEVVRLRDGTELLNPDWITDQLNPTARALLVGDYLREDADVARRHAYARLTGLFPDLLER
jgi:hypothetical protein